MKLFMRSIGIGMVICGVLIFGSLLGLSVFGGWVLASPSGARWAIDWLPRAGIADLHVESVDGRLLGPLRLEGLKLATPGADVAVDHVLLDWSPLSLITLGIKLESLDVGTLQVTLKDRETAQEAPPPPSIPELPVSVEIQRVRMARLELNLPARNEVAAQQQLVRDFKLDEMIWKGDSIKAQLISAEHQFSGAIEAHFEAHLATKAVRLDQLTLRSATDQALQLNAKGLLRLDQGKSFLDVEWAHLRWPLVGEEIIADSREGKLHVEGALDDATVDGTFALGQSARIEAKARYAKQLIDAKLSWQDFQWPLRGTATAASKRGSLDFKGAPEDFRYRLDALIRAEGRDGKAQASGSGGTHHVVLDTLQLDVAQSHIEGKARVNWKSQLIVDADLKLKNVNPGLAVPEWPGRINGALKARTEMRANVPHVKFEVALGDSKLRDYPLQLDAKGEMKGQTVIVDAMDLRSARTQLKARGQITPPFKAVATFSSPDLSTLLADLSGDAELALELRGTLEAPHLIAVGEVNKFSYQGTSVEQLAIDADVNIDSTWNLELKAQKLRGPTEMRLAQIKLKGTAQNHLLNIAVDAKPLSADLQAEGAFDPKARRWSGFITQGHIAPAELAPWTLESAAALSADASSAQLEPACWRANESRVCVQGLRDGDRARTAMRIDKLDFAYLAKYMPQGWSLTGGADGTAVAEIRDGQLLEARADLETLPLLIERNGQIMLSAAAGTLKVSDTEGGTVAKLQLPVKDGRINLDAMIAANHTETAKRNLEATLDIALPDLAILRIASTEIEHASGSLEGRIRWSGTVGRPEALGFVKLADGRIHLATPGIELSDVVGDFALAPDRSVSLNAKAKSGGGELRLTGEASLAQTPVTAAIHIDGDEFQATNMTEMRAWISPDLNVAIKGEEIRISGKVDVPRAEITPVSFDSGVGPSSDQIIVRGEKEPTDPPTTRLFSDVEVVLGENVRIDGFGLKTQLVGKLRAIDKPGRPGTGRGEIRMVGGHYKAYGQDLAIDTGKVMFVGGPLTQPAVEIRANRVPAENIEVGVLVRGTLEDPDFQLFSSPAMPRERQLSWLILGRSLEDGGGGDERQALANAALALGLSQTDSVAKNIKGGLRLDEISIGSQPGEDASQASLTVGKYLSPKLFVSYGLGLFQPGQVFKLLYDLGHGFKIATESGVQTGGDLLYSIESK